MPENRLGMIVCGAFLGLASAVAVAKLRGPAAEPEPAAAAAAETAPPKTDPAPAVTPPEILPEPVPAAPVTQSVALPEPEPAPAPRRVEPPAPMLPEPAPAAQEPAPARVALNELPVSPGGFRRVGATEPEPDQHNPPSPAPPAPPNPKIEPPPPPPPAPAPPEPAAPALPPLSDKAENDEGAPKPPEKGADEGKPKPPIKEAKIPVTDKADPGAPPAPAPLPGPKEIGEPPPLPGPPTLPAPPGPAEPPAPKPPEKVMPVAPPVKPEPPSPAPQPDKVTVVIPPTPAPRPVEPPAFAPTSIRPPVASAPPAGGPLVDSWDERTYTAKPGDTYEAISLSEYKTEDYAKALQMYNQNHPRAGDAMRRDGAMAPGDRIYLPPSPVLEKRHADVIVRSRPKPVTAGPAGDLGGPVQAEFRVPADKPANPTYKVQGGGETLFQIAAQQLRDGNRWKEIAALNPRAPTDGAVLGGTLLKMPAASADGAPPPPHP